MSAAENSFPQSLPPESVEGLLPGQTERVLPEVMAKWAWRLGTAQAEIEELLSFISRRTGDVSRRFTVNLSERSRQIRNQHPLRLLGIIAGAAFGIGAAAAFWKPHR